MSFQKGSKFLDDINYLIDINKEMGIHLTMDWLLRDLPNATKCLAWHDVKESHTIDASQVVVNLEDSYGIMVLLAIGLCGGMITLIVEKLLKAQKPTQKITSANGKWIIGILVFFGELCRKKKKAKKTKN